MGLKIDKHDYETKRRNVEKFLSGGDKVKVQLRFRGREQSRPEMGLRLLGQLAEDVSEFGFVETRPRQEGRNMTMVLGPTKKKSQARAEARKRKSAAEKAAAAEKQQRAEAKAQHRAEAAGAADATPSAEASASTES